MLSLNIVILFKIILTQEVHQNNDEQLGTLILLWCKLLEKFVDLLVLSYVQWLGSNFHKFNEFIKVHSNN